MIATPSSASSVPSLGISNSEMRTFQRCPRQWMLNYYYRFQPKPASISPVGVALLGTRVHLSLEAYYGYGLNPLQVLGWEYSRVQLLYPDWTEELDKERSMALAMVEGYLDWTASEGIDAGLTVVATEKLVQQYVGTFQGVEVYLRAKLDQLIRREFDGAILLRDFKTVGTLSKANDLQLDQQMRVYALIQALQARATGERPDGCLYTMLKRSKRTARAKGPFYEQVEIRYNKHDLNSAWLHVQEVCRRIVETRKRLEAGEDHRQVCYASSSDFCSWGCEFYSQCSLMDDGSRWQDAIRSDFTQSDPYAYYESDGIDRVLKAFGKAATATP